MIMKKLLLSILPILLLYSCDEAYTSDYSIKNNSSHTITIVDYKSDSLVKILNHGDTGLYRTIDTFIIHSGKDTTRHRSSYNKTPELYNFFSQFEIELLSDSAYMYFDSTKFLKFLSIPSISDPIKRNILDVQHSFINKGTAYYIYEITDEDYERAEWIKK